MRRFSLPALSPVLLVLSACGGDFCGEGMVFKSGNCVLAQDTGEDGGNDDDGGDDTGTPATEDSTDDTGAHTGGGEDSGGPGDTDTGSELAVDPSIILFEPDRSSMSPGDTVGFSVIVTDPQGIADLIGGNLESADGSTYGVFATAGDEGAYALDVPWADIERLGSVPDFTSATSLTFAAVFYDSAAHFDRAEATVSLTCPAATPNYCDGACHPDVETSCNGVDDDCDPSTEDDLDADGDGAGVCTDCDDADATIAPSAEEVCDNGVDDDCDGDADEDCVDSYDGSWSMDTTVDYSCAYGLVDINFSGLSIVSSGSSITVDPSGSSVDALTGSYSSSTEFSAEDVIAGTCKQTFSIEGSFSSYTALEATFRLSFSGTCFDCTNQSWSFSASR